MLNHCITYLIISECELEFLETRLWSCPSQRSLQSGPDQGRIERYWIQDQYISVNTFGPFGADK